MLTNAHLHAPDVARQELRLFLHMCQQAGLDTDRQLRSLRLSQDDWRRWLGILDDAPLPAQPALPVMLRHLGYVNHRLECAARGRRNYTQNG